MAQYIWDNKNVGKHLARYVVGKKGKERVKNRGKGKFTGKNFVTQYIRVEKIQGKTHGKNLARYVVGREVEECGGKNLVT